MTDVSQIRTLIEGLHERGVRERFLHKHVVKLMSYVSTKCKSNAAELDVNEIDRQIYEKCSYGAPRDSGRYCKSVALRFDAAVIEEIETLEEKISNSSMQVRGWKPTIKIGANPDLRLTRRLALFTPSVPESSNSVLNEILEAEESTDDEEDEEKDEGTDTLSLGKERLLATEAMIERRYLKPPLGFKANTVLVSSGSTDELAENAADENAPSGLIRWREAVRECSTTSQLALLLHFLELSIAWDKSIMRAVMTDDIPLIHSLTFIPDSNRAASSAAVARTRLSCCCVMDVIRDTTCTASNRRWKSFRMETGSVSNVKIRYVLFVFERLHISSECLL